MTVMDPESKAWNAWLRKNAEKDKAYFRKLARTAVIAVLIALACLLIWAWAHRDVKAYDLERTRARAAAIGAVTDRAYSRIPPPDGRSVSAKNPVPPLQSID